jgi:hypothetical protein
VSRRDLDNVVVTTGDRNHQRWLREAEADADPPPPSRPTAIELAAGIRPIELFTALQFSGLYLLVDIQRDVLVITRKPSAPEAA